MPLNPVLNRPSSGGPVEKLLDSERWADARALLRQLLRDEPDSHWLLIRLSMAYYEEHRYKLALRFAERAFELAPTWPLVLWDYAGALQMLGRHSEALDLYARLVSKGVAGVARNPCSEGKAWARGLVSDSHYQASNSLSALGNKAASLSAFTQCLDLRGPGCHSIYKLGELV